MKFIFYDDVKNKRKSNFELQQLEFSDFGPVVYDDDFKDDIDTLALRTLLPDAVFAVTGRKAHLVVGFVRASEDGVLDKCIAVIYFEDRHFMWASLALEGEFLNWMEAIANRHDRSFIVESGGFQFEFGVNTSGSSSGFLVKRGIVEAEANPIKFVKRHAPMFFKKDMVNAAKKKFFSRSKVTDGQRPRLDLSSLKTKFASLIAKQNLSLGEGASEADFAELEAQVGYALPSEYQEIYKLSNGLANAILGMPLMSLNEIIKEWKNWQSVYEDWTIEELRDGYSGVKGKTFGVYCQPGWLPFVNLYGGNFLAIDMTPLKSGKLGQVIRFGADIYHISQVAEDLEEFLSRCLEAADDPAAPFRKNLC